MSTAMFSGFMTNAWIVATLVAVAAGLVGSFVVLRGSAFVAHAIPSSAFAGAAAASLLGINTLAGLAAFALLGAFGIAWLGRRGRHDVATALVLVFLLGLGALFLSMTDAYAPQVYSLLFGEVLGISTTQIAPTAALVIVCVAAVAAFYRPLLLSSLLPEVGAARGVSPFRIELGFLVIVAVATTLTVPVVGTLLVFSLMIGPPAAARSFTNRPGRAIALSISLAVLTAWAAIALAYTTDYPIGFFVGATSTAWYTTGRSWAAARRRLTHATPLPTPGVAA